MSVLLRPSDLSAQPALRFLWSVMARLRLEKTMCRRNMPSAA